MFPGSLRNAADIEDVHWVVVANVAGELMLDGGVLPGLWNGTIVKRVRLVRPDAGDEPWLVALAVVENGV
jgi:hypothetical protein